MEGLTEISITASGPAKAGKSTLLFIIEDALKDKGIYVRWEGSSNDRPAMPRKDLFEFCRGLFIILKEETTV